LGERNDDHSYSNSDEGQPHGLETEAVLLPKDDREAFEGKIEYAQEE
jgi:hypothetical protein